MLDIPSLFQIRSVLQRPERSNPINNLNLVFFKPKFVKFD